MKKTTKKLIAAVFIILLALIIGTSIWLNIEDKENREFIAAFDMRHPEAEK